MSDSHATGMALLRSMRGFVLLLLFSLLGAAQAQQMRYEGIGDYGYAWSRTWVDVNGDGRDDYCVLAGSDAERLECYFSDGATFGNKRVLWLGHGKPEKRSTFRWADVDGDGLADFCRLITSYSGTAPATAQMVCWFGPNQATSTATAIDLWSSWSEPGCYEGCPITTTDGLDDIRLLYMADVNGDAMADLCYVHVGSSNPQLRCRLALPARAGFSAVSAAWTLPNYYGGLLDYSHGAVDFNGDGLADFCRVIPGGVRCAISTPNGFAAQEVSSQSMVASPWGDGSAFVDANGDGTTDFCRIVGVTGSGRLSCLMSNGRFWEAEERSSKVLDTGHPLNRHWVDINGDGLPDFCRFAGAISNNRADFACRLGQGDSSPDNDSAFALTDVTMTNVEFGMAPGGGRGFCDATGSGLQTYCRPTMRRTPGVEFCWTTEGAQECRPTVIDISGVLVGIQDESLSYASGPPPVQAFYPLLTSVSDGVGAETRVSYLPATDPDVYSRSTVGSGGPRALVIQPRSPLVYETRAWRTGTQEALTGNARYFYKDLRVDTWGGSRGFRERWILHEGANTLDHSVFFQGLGPAVDASSKLNDVAEIGLVKYQERFAVASAVLPTSVPTWQNMSARSKALRSATRSALGLPGGRVNPVVPTASSPFVLLQRTTNTLSDTVPANPGYRYVGKSIVEAWDWNGGANTLVQLPTMESTFSLDDVGNVLSTVQTTLSNGSMWRKTTINEYRDNRSLWLLGRLTKSTVSSEAPTRNDQLALHPRSQGTLAGAGDMSSSAPAVPQPISPAVLSVILQLLLDD